MAFAEELGFSTVMEMTGINQGAAEYNKRMSELSGVTDKHAGLIGQALGTVTKVVAGVGVAAVAAFAAFGAAAFKAGSELDEAYDKMIISTGKEGDSLAGLQADFKKVFTSIPTDAKSASAAMSELSKRLDISGDALVNLSKPLLEATRMLGGDAKKNAESVSEVIKKFGMNANEGAGLVDKLFKASQASGVEFSTLATQISRSGATLKGMGFNIDETISYFAQWEKQGVVSTQAIAGLRQAMAEFNKDGTSGTKTMSEKLKEAQEEIKGAATEAEALSIAMKIFGNRAGPEFAQQIRDGNFAIDDMMKALEGSEGTVMKTAAATADLGERVTIFKNKITTALAPMGLVIMDLGSAFLDRLMPAIDGFATFVNDKILPMFTDLTDNITAAANSGLGLQDMFEGLLTNVLDAFGMSEEQIGTFFESLNAIEAKVAEFAAAIPKALGMISAGNEGGAAASLLKAMGLDESLSEKIGTIVGDLTDSFEGAFGGLVDSMLTIINDLFSGDIAGAVQGGIDLAFDFPVMMAGLQGDVIKALTKLGDTILDQASEMFPDLQPFIDDFLRPVLDIASDIGALLEPVSEIISDLARTIFDAGTDLIMPVLDGLIGLIGDVVDQVKIVVDAVKENLPQIKALIESVMIRVQSVFEEVLPHVKDFVKEIGPFLAEAIKTATPIVDRISEIIAKMAKDVLPVVIDKAREIIAFIREKMPQIKETVESVLKAVEDVWNRVWPILQVTIDTVWKEIKIIIDRGLKIIKGITDFVSGVFSGDWDKAWKGIWSVLDNIEGLIGDTIGNIIGGIVNLFGGAGEKVSAAIGGLWEKSKLYIKGQWDTLVASWQAIFDVVGLIENVVGGVILAIENKAEEVSKWFVKMFTGAVDAVKKFFGIKSPSTLMRDLMVQVIQGAEVGIDIEGVKLVAEFMELFEKIIGGLKGTMGFLQALDDWKLPEIATDKLKAISQFLADLIGILAPYTSIHSGEGVAWVTQWAESLEKIVSVLKPVMEALTGLATYTEGAGLKDKAIGMMKSLSEVLDAIINVAKDYDVLGITYASLFTSAATEIVALIKPVIEAILTLAQYTEQASLTGKVRDMLARLFEIVPELAKLNETYKDMGLEAAIEVTKNITSILGIIRPGLEAIQQLNAYVITASLVEKTAAFRLALTQIVTGLTSGIGEAEALVARTWDKAIEFYSYLNGIIGIIRPGIEAVYALSTYITRGGMKEKADALRFDLLAIGKALYVETADETRKNAAEAAEFWGILGGIINVIKPGIEAVENIFRYVSRGDLGAKALSFRQDLFSVASALAVATRQETRDFAEEAMGFLATVASIVSVIKPAIESLTALFAYEHRQGIADQAKDFKEDFFAVASALAVATSEGTRALATEAAGFLASITAVVSVVKPAIEAINALFAYEHRQELASQAKDFQEDLMYMADALMIATTEETRTLAEAAAGFWANVKDIVAIIKPGIEALTQLFTYESRQEIDSLANRFREDLHIVVEELLLIASGMAIEGLQNASIAATAMKGILDIIKPGIEALKSLFEYEDRIGVSRAASIFRQDLRSLIEELKTIGQGLDLEGLQAAEQMAKAMKGILEIVKPGIEAISSLIEMTSSTLPQSKMDAFKVNLSTIITALNVQLSEEQMTKLKAAAEVWEVAKEVIAIIKPGIEAVAALAEMQATALPASKVTLLANDLLLIIGTLKQVGEQEGVNLVSMTALADLFKAIKEVMSAAKVSVEGIVAMSAYTKQAGLEPKMTAFVNDFATVRLALMAIQRGINVDALNAAKDTLAGVKELVELVTEAMDRVIDLQWSTADARRAFITIGTDIQAGVTAFITAMQYVAWQLSHWEGAGSGIGDLMIGLRLGLENGFEGARTAIAEGLDTMENEFSNSISTFFNLGAAAGYAWAEGFNSAWQPPSSDYNPPAQGNSLSGGSTTTNSTIINVPINGAQINNGMDLASLQTVVLQTVRDAIRR